MPYSTIHLAGKYIAYRFRALNGKGHGMHSPFVYDFIRRVLNDRQEYPVYRRVEGLRKEMLKNHNEINVLDLGAGSTTGAGSNRKISAIARNAAKPSKYGQLLFRLAHHYQAKKILELGTSLGISTSYLSLAQPEGSVITLEGSPEIAQQAAANFNRLELKNITQVLGNFDDTLAQVLQQIQSVDLAFIDGNHQLEPTVRYFNEILAYCHNESIIVFDDIHWSAGMEEAWSQIKQHPSVRTSIDLFFVGIVFFRKEFREVQHFEVRY